ncbi:MAG: hypothetical protein HC852_01775 [Acaryochloridaceae cyanobacterium RU_4_10]|nr:hypothetical protein [Acaryochloridaceae cyanobacterium RU_4_10]
MNKPEWDEQFTQQLQTRLQIAPADIRYPWASFRIAGYSPSHTIAYLIELHRLYPKLELLPMAAPKYGMSEAVVRSSNGECDRIVAVRWTRSTYYYWAYQVEGGFGRNPNAWFAERILEPIAKSVQENFAEVS